MSNIIKWDRPVKVRRKPIGETPAANPGVVQKFPTPKGWLNVLDVYAAVAAIEARPNFDDRRDWWGTHVRNIGRALKGRVTPDALREIVRQHTAEVRIRLADRSAAGRRMADG